MHPAAAPSLPWPAMCPAAPPTTAPLMHPLASAAPTEASATATAQIAADVSFMRFSDSKYRGLNSLRDTRFLDHQVIPAPGGERSPASLSASPNERFRPAIE